MFQTLSKACKQLICQGGHLTVWDPGIYCSSLSGGKQICKADLPCRDLEHTTISRQQHRGMPEAVDDAGNRQHEEGCLASCFDGQLLLGIL